MTNSPASPPSWLKIFRLGQHYMKTWPTDKRLIAVFPENRIAHATRFALRAAPPLAAFTLAWQIAFADQLAAAITMTLFICSLPMQGLWWLGKRAITPLPPSLLSWFYTLRSKLVDAGQTLTPLEGTPTYQSLADILKRAFKQLDATFLDDL
ncbi:terminus macrodomain insulation protein YfbV [Serratia microhaemolytica]|uniref:terminus macrodomain insulation protein YfbV n=1 Tax=Serratia microhaemolytica TaxID=2675110 RepID=UPI000FDE3C3F|nr:terminus macrodomain insulation protein YfbV [Serratia microhaemolytica]